MTTPRLLCCAGLGQGDLQTFIFLVSACLLAILVMPNQAQESCSGGESPSDCRPGETTFNVTTGCCEPCSTCQRHEKMFVASECNITHDAVCDCQSPTYLDATREPDEPAVCALSCALCPSLGGPRSGECIPGRPECRCINQDCHFPGDIYCDGPTRCGEEITHPTTTPPDRTPLTGFDPNTVPAWGIGLIAVGIVIGIIIFASCFLCMGIFSMHRNSDPESQRGSESSENGLVPRDSFSSVGTKSSYVSSSSSMYPYLSSHSMLELLKNSSPQLLHSKDKLSSAHSSPVSTRANPKPGISGTASSHGMGVVRLAKNSSTDKLTAVVLT